MSSDSSLDSELLAVAGRGGGKKRGRAVSASESEEQSDESVSLEDESDWEAQEEAPSSKRRATGRASGRATPAQRRSGAADGGNDRDGPLEFDEEDLIEDEADRERLNALTELQREYELAERADRKQQEQQRQHLLKQAGEVAAKAPAKKKEKEPRAMRSTREIQEEKGKKLAMEELKAARERKARGDRARKMADDDDEEGDWSDEEGALPSDEDRPLFEPDDERRYAARRGLQDDDEDEAPVEDVRSITVRRHLLEEYIKAPHFESTLPGCMVRVGVGERTGPDGISRPAYNLCQVLAVEERGPGLYKDCGKPWKSPYPFGPGEEKTSKWLVVERGHSQRGMPLSLVSNQTFTEREFDSWQAACGKDRRRQVSRRDVADVRDRLIKAATYTYTAEDVQRLLEEKKAKGQAPRNAALEKARLQRQRDAAREAGDEDAALKQEAQITALEGQMAAAKERRGGRGMEDINKRNADANFQNALRNVGNKVDVGTTAGQDSEAADTLDPFSRRMTRPVVYWNTKQKRQQPEEDDLFGKAEEAEGTAGASAAEAAITSPRGAKAGPLDVDSVVDLSCLDLSLLDRAARMPPIARKLLGPAWSLPAVVPAGGRVISLEEFNRTRGLA